MSLPTIQLNLYQPENCYLLSYLFNIDLWNLTGVSHMVPSEEQMYEANRIGCQGIFCDFSLFADEIRNGLPVNLEHLNPSTLGIFRALGS
jgi:hypothetical protein